MKIENYKGIKAVEEVEAITEEQVMDALVRHQQANTGLKAVDRPTEMGDTVNIDFKGFVGDEQFAGGTAEDYELVLGSHTFIPGFEDQLVGKVAGQDVDVNVTFPDEYTPELAGKAAVFKCTVNSVNVKYTPEIDDEYAKKYCGVDTVEQMKVMAKADLASEALEAAKAASMETILAQIIESNTIEPNEEEIAYEAERAISLLLDNMGAGAIGKSKYCEMTGMDEAELDKMIRPSAVKNAQVRIIIDSVAEQEGIDISEEELQQGLESLAKGYNLKAEEIKDYVDLEILKKELKIAKVLDFIYTVSDIERK